MKKSIMVYVFIILFICGCTQNELNEDMKMNNKAEESPKIEEDGRVNRDFTQTSDSTTEKNSQEESVGEDTSDSDIQQSKNIIFENENISIANKDTATNSKYYESELSKDYIEVQWHDGGDVLYGYAYLNGDKDKSLGYVSFTNNEDAFIWCDQYHVIKNGLTKIDVRTLNEENLYSENVTDYMDSAISTDLSKTVVLKAIDGVVQVLIYTSDTDTPEIVFQDPLEYFESAFFAIVFMDNDNVLFSINKNTSELRLIKLNIDTKNYEEVENKGDYFIDCQSPNEKYVILVETGSISLKLYNVETMEFENVTLNKPYIFYENGLIYEDKTHEKIMYYNLESKMSKELFKMSDIEDINIEYFSSFYSKNNELYFFNMNNSWNYETDSPDIPVIGNSYQLILK